MTKALMSASAFYFVLTSEYIIGAKSPGCNDFAGDNTDEETPDPIPNSEAKLVGPMVVLMGRE